jgi:hypothetical protein
MRLLKRGRLTPVETRVATRSSSSTLHERETIVFARRNERAWLAVHEHLSAGPGAVEAQGAA